MFKEPIIFSLGNMSARAKLVCETWNWVYGQGPAKAELWRIWRLVTTYLYWNVESLWTTNKNVDGYRCGVLENIICYYGIIVSDTVLITKWWTTLCKVVNESKYCLSSTYMVVAFMENPVYFQFKPCPPKYFVFIFKMELYLFIINRGFFF